MYVIIVTVTIKSATTITTTTTNTTITTITTTTTATTTTISSAYNALSTPIIRDRLSTDDSVGTSYLCVSKISLQGENGINLSRRSHLRRSRTLSSTPSPSLRPSTCISLSSRRGSIPFSCGYLFLAVVSQSRRIDIVVVVRCHRNVVRGQRLRV